MGHAPLVDMADTVPVLSSKRARGEDAHFWIPRKGTSVGVFWSGIDGLGDHVGVPGTWHPATAPTMRWPGGKGGPGLCLRCTDGVKEWAAISLFGDTVVLVESTKKMRCSTKDKKGKQGVAGGTDKPPEGAAGWLGHGATVQVTSKGRSGGARARSQGGILREYCNGPLHRWGRGLPWPAHEGMQNKYI